MYIYVYEYVTRPPPKPKFLALSLFLADIGHHSNHGLFPDFRTIEEKHCRE